MYLLALSYITFVQCVLYKEKRKGKRSIQSWPIQASKILHPLPFPLGYPVRLVFFHHPSNISILLFSFLYPTYPTPQSLSA